MNNEETKQKVRSAAENILQREDYISPIGLLLEIGVLTKRDYEEWRMGRVLYLERVCGVNLNKMSLIMAELKSFAAGRSLKPSTTVYKKWGKGKRVDLKFSKSGDLRIEQAYRTHYVNLVRDVGSHRESENCNDPEIAKVNKKQIT